MPVSDDCKENFPAARIDTATLRARKGYLGLRSEDLVERGVGSWATVSAFFRGGQSQNLATVRRLAAELGLRVEIRFVPDSE